MHDSGLKEDFWISIAGAALLGVGYHYWVGSPALTFAGFVPTVAGSLMIGYSIPGFLRYIASWFGR